MSDPGVVQLIDSGKYEVMHYLSHNRDRHIACDICCPCTMGRVVAGTMISRREDVSLCGPRQIDCDGSFAPVENNHTYDRCRHQRVHCRCKAVCRLLHTLQIVLRPTAIKIQDCLDIRMICNGLTSQGLLKSACVNKTDKEAYPRTAALRIGAPIHISSISIRQQEPPPGGGAAEAALT